MPESKKNEISDIFLREGIIDYQRPLSFKSPDVDKKTSRIRVFNHGGPLRVIVNLEVDVAEYIRNHPIKNFLNLLDVGKHRNGKLNYTLIHEFSFEEGSFKERGDSLWKLLKSYTHPCSMHPDLPISKNSIKEMPPEPFIDEAIRLIEMEKEFLKGLYKSLYKRKEYEIFSRL